MLLFAPPAFAAILIGLGAVQPLAATQAVTRLVVEDQIVLRVPVAPPPSRRRLKWIEAKGPKCIPAGAIRGALLSSPEQVDLMLANKRRVRAKFSDDCPGLDYYGGFYLEIRDRKICAGRNSIHARMGGECTIGAFHWLVPRPREPGAAASVPSE